MAENIVAGLFGLTPEMYGEQQRTSALAEGIRLAQLDPAARGAAMTYAGARGLGGAIAGAMGIEDPQLRMISQTNQLMQGLNLSDPQSLQNAAQQASQMGNVPLAMKLIELSDNAQIRLQQAQLRAQQAETQRQTSLAQLVAQRAYQPGTPERAQMLDEQERQQMADQGTPMPENIPAVAPSFDIGRVAPELMRTPEGRKQLEELSKAQASVETASVNQLAAQLFNPDGTKDVYWIQSENSCGIPNINLPSKPNSGNYTYLSSDDVFGASRKYGYKGGLQCNMVKKNEAASGIFFCQNLSNPEKRRNCY